MKRSLSALLLALAMTLSLTACAPTADPSSAPAESAGPATVSFTDSCGRTVEIPAEIDRVAPSGPLAQIVLFALAPEKFVGLASKWSKEAGEFIDADYYNLPVLGQLYGSSAADLNLETLAAADPQIIIDIGEPKKTIVEDMDAITEQLGIPAIHIDAYTASMGETYRILGQVLGLSDEAEALAAYCEEIYANTLSLMERVGENKAKALYLVGDQGLNVIARGAYHAELIDLMTDNQAVVDQPSSKGTGNEVDMEQLLLWDPDVILFGPSGSSNGPSLYETVGEDPTWGELTAIRTGNYYEVPFGPYNWMGFPPSVNRYLGMLWAGTLLYPDQADYDLYTEAARYYQLFYHCELTREQFDALTAHSTGAK